MTPEADTIRSTLVEVDGKLIDNQVDLNYHEVGFDKNLENHFRSNFYQQVNALLQTLSLTDPRCIETIGGWKSLLPSLIGVASVATGYGAFANQAVAGAALEVTANLTNLLSNQRVKGALNDLIKVQNDQILACTYYSLSIRHVNMEEPTTLAKIQKK